MRERAQVLDAQRALELRAAPLGERARGLHPLVLLGSAVIAGLFAGRVFGWPRLARGVRPEALLATAVQAPLARAIERLLGEVFSAASGDSKSDSPPETRDRSP